MEKEIKNYLPFYLGCKIKSQYGVSILEAISNDGLCRLGQSITVNCNEIKPILRPLSDMTEEEKTIVDKISMKLQTVSWKLGCAEVTQYLLSKHFDLFGLYEAGLCLYKSDLK